MENELEKIDELIKRAKRLRDRPRYEDAISVLDEQAIPLINSELVSASSTYKLELGRRLADCYGIQGGCYRRWALRDDPPQDQQTRNQLLLDSVKRYQKGQEVESNKEYGIVSTYNLLNRIVSQILLDPRYLSNPAAAAADHPELGSFDARVELEKVEEEMKRQLHRDDSWFPADEALVSLLLDRNDPDPKEVYSKFLDPQRRHPDFIYESMLATLKPLAQLDLPMAHKLKEIVELLNERLEQLRQ